MPRKIKKLEGMEATPSRQESVPGPAPEKKRSLVTPKEQYKKTFENKYKQTQDELDVAEDLYRMEPTDENASAVEKIRDEAQRQYLHLEKMGMRDEKAARLSRERASVKATVEGMDDQVQSERREKKSMQQAEHQSNLGELISDSGVEIPGRESKSYTRKQLEDLDREWAERVKRDIEISDSKAATKAEALRKAGEAVRGSLEPHKVRLEEMDREAAGERIKANVQAERASAEMDPARKRSIAKLKKLEAEHAATGQRIADLTGMSAEDAYEKLILNGGFMARIKRGMAKLANVPTYDLLDSWIESGKKMEEVDREVVGPLPDFGHEVRAKGLRARADEEMATKAAIGRDDARRYREVPLDMSKPVGETSDETLMEDVKAMKTKEFNEAIEKSRIELVARAKAKAEAEEIPVEVTEPMSAEEFAIENDFRMGIVRDAEGRVIEDEKKIRAKRPMSRVAGRKVSMGQTGVVDAMARAESVPVYQPGEEAEQMPRSRKAKAEVPVVEENEMLKFQRERASDINVVRKEYPRAAEVWNSIASRLQGMEQSQLEDMYKIFGTRDLATAYVLDRAFSDMDGDKKAIARLQQADKILGIEEVAPKKVKSKPANGKAA